MNQQVLQQSLSALMDNEADELELHRVLKATDEPELRAAWTRYQVARAAMHNEAAFASIDLSAQIMDAIDAEPALAAPVADTEIIVPRKAGSMAWLGRVAVAASVTLAVLGGVRFYNQDALPQDALVAQSEQRLPATSQAQGSVVLASYNAQGQSAPVAETVAGQESWYERRLPSYLRQHAQQSGVNKTESGLPYARAASLEGQ
ncbi:MAG: anti-sigma factor [Thiopseudomonas sp.]|nr:anti-sigma factor [Thiopseudomonas sp.]MBP7996946.1 anti-sigma factor [Thiopseudomonas sp.]